ncbi:MAG: molybdopterin biosynthesis protein, partial [Anaerolineales bacterium]
MPEALARLEQALAGAGLLGLLGEETIPLDEKALGRVLAQAVFAKISSPHYHAAAMDGFALRAEETAGAMPTAQVTLVYGQQAVYVDTGDPLPGWANAVVPIENSEALDQRGDLHPDSRKPYAIRIRAALPPW